MQYRVKMMFTFLFLVLTLSLSGCDLIGLTPGNQECQLDEQNSNNHCSSDEPSDQDSVDNPDEPDEQANDPDESEDQESDENQDNPGTGTSKEIVGYYPSWQWYDRNNLVNPATIPYEKFDIINFAFFYPKADGTIVGTDSWADDNILRGQPDWQNGGYLPNTSLIDLAHEHNVKVLLSLGGWTLSSHFPAVAADPAKRAYFANECVRMIEEYGFDGMDIDWEYPGYTPHNGTLQDKQNFTLLLQTVRKRLDEYGNKRGKRYLLTAALPAGPERVADIEVEKVALLLDSLNLMTYDFFGAFDPISNHNSPLYAPVQGVTSFNVDAAFRLFNQQYGVPANKLNIGVPFYGRSFSGCSALFGTHSGSDTKTWPDDEGTPLYYNILNLLDEFTQHFDQEAQVPYAISSSQNSFLSYDNEESVSRKADYVLEKDARGVIIWEITGDFLEDGSTPLLDVLNQKFSAPDNEDLDTDDGNDSENSEECTAPETGAYVIPLSELKNREAELTDSDLMRLVKRTIATLQNEEVELIQPGRKENPANVKRVERIISEGTFDFLFPVRAKEYTYIGFLRSVGKFPSFCSDYSDGRNADEICRKSLVTMFAHFTQETGGHTNHWPEPEWRQGLYWVREMGWTEEMRGGYNAECDLSTWQGQTWPCGKFPNGDYKSYFGRGAKQLSYNYNYGPFSDAMFGTVRTLLDQPELVADTWLNLASAVFFFVYPQPPKPSMLFVIDGSWQPNQHDISNGLKPGLGVTTQIINGGVECGGSEEIAQSQNRISYYQSFSGYLNVDIPETEVLGCKGMKQFDEQGSGALPIFWEQDWSWNPDMPDGKSFACKLVGYQTPFTALKEGDYIKCVEHFYNVYVDKCN